MRQMVLASVIVPSRIILVQVIHRNVKNLDDLILIFLIFLRR